MRVRKIPVYRTCQSLFAGAVTISMGTIACYGQIPVVENSRAPVVQVAPVVKATGNRSIPPKARPSISQQPIPIITKNQQSQQLKEDLLRPLRGSDSAADPVIAGFNPLQPMPAVPDQTSNVATPPNGIPVIEGNYQEFARTPGSMVQASSILPPGIGPSQVAPPRMGLPGQPVFDGSWTPVSPAPVSTSNMQVHPAGQTQDPTPASFLDTPAVTDGQLMLGSEIPAVTNCDCGSGECNECSQLGFSMTAGHVSARPGIGDGSGPLKHIRGKISGVFHGGTHYGMCGFCPDASRYLVADGLYWSRGDGDINGNNFGGVGGSNAWDSGWRITAGARRDSVSGIEASVMGLSPITDSLTSNSAAGSINALFTPAGGFNALQTGSFYNATETWQEASTQLYSIELNRVRYSWDVARTHWGMRYIWFEDDYLYRSTSAAGTGVYGLSAINQMIGPEAGLDLYHDVGRKLSFSGFGKLGGYLNFTRIDTDLINNGTTYINNRNTDADLSASLELGGNALMHLSQHTRLRVGYNAMWLWQVASYDDNFPQFMTPTTGQDPDSTGDAFLHGANFGIEIYR